VQGSESEAGVAAEKTFESDEVVKGSRTEVERIVAWNAGVTVDRAAVDEILIRLRICRNAGVNNC
jgi:hypothetical protein